MAYRIKVLLLACSPALLSAQDKVIDVERSTITIHVGKAGLFSAAGHDHWVSAPVASGSINDSNSPGVEFKVETASMKVKPDPKVDEKTQAAIQRDMEQLTLEISKYPEIEFHSTRAEPAGAGQWKVDGMLTLHGVTRPVTVNVKRSGESYTGRVVLKQTDFRIKPVSVGGGVVKVKNEVDIEFQIFSRGS